LYVKLVEKPINRRMWPAGWLPVFTGCSRPSDSIYVIRLHTHPGISRLGTVVGASLLLNVQHAYGNKTDPALLIHHVYKCMVRMKRGRGRRERGSPRGRRNRVPRMRSSGDTRVRTRRRKQRASSRAAAAACSMRTGWEAKTTAARLRWGAGTAAPCDPGHA
jgi:hypothetical protein